MKFEVMKSIIPSILVFGCSTPCAAAANVAMQPTSVRQGYSDGSSTELACFDASCSFSVLKNGRKVSYELANTLFGYRIAVSTYYFFEETRINSFFLYLPVSCTDEDLGRLPELDRNTAGCDLLLEPRSRVLIATHIRVSGIAQERYISDLRKLYCLPSNPADCESQ